MKELNLLLGNGEEIVNDLLESTVQEVCGVGAQVHCTRTGVLEEFIAKGCTSGFDLIILIPNILALSKTGSEAGAKAGAGAVAEIKSHRPTPVIALPAFEARAEEERQMRSAGADCVLELPFNRNQLKAAIAHLLKLPRNAPVLAAQRRLTQA